MPREIALSAGVLLGAACLFAASGPAVILNSGSTNTAGFRLTIEKSGNAEFAPMPRKYGPQSPGSTESARYKLPDAVVRRFYSDLEAARPLGNLPRTRCMKSASFGTNTIIQFGGEETPDLSCPNASDARTQALMRDIREIEDFIRSR
ncbi:MAG TPA: hypothetical protein VKV74_03715 [Bryobacteraceae bacterium]|nr:hypothetical protein [Bryobacteraceae bacterium]